LKLILDEMYTAAVAEQLRERDHDVIAVAERADLRGTADEDLLAWARTEDCALVTDNQRDFIPIHHRCIAGGHDHKGLILTNNRRFPRGQPATTGKLVVALERFLHTTAPSIARNSSFIHWLQ
jgi:predicted nuclease of predicted toxin-antitoxin system